MSTDVLELKFEKPQNLIGLGWQAHLTSGWGVFAYYFALELARQKNKVALLLDSIELPVFANPTHLRLLGPALEERRRLEEFLKPLGDRRCAFNIPVVHALHNKVTLEKTTYTGERNIGFIFFEHTGFDEAAVARSREFERIIAGSTWNAEVLRARNIPTGPPVFQGVDLSLHHPAPKTNLFKDRFVVFSGGKLEYRKGQDIVLAAFRQFHARHPDAFLITNWQNQWPWSARGIDRAGHVQGTPGANSFGWLDLPPWIRANGVADNDTMELGLMYHHVLPPVLREADVALFPNRCEGGTNLVAMECLACGIPTILSANTGHLDIIRDAHCYPLRDQKPVTIPEAPGETEGWGESSVDDVVAALEAVYADRAEAARRGAVAAEFMKDWTWENQIGKLLTAMGC